MKVFKFGGASLRSAAGIRQVCKIVSQTDLPLVMVVSAMGNTTDLLEIICQRARAGATYQDLVDKCHRYHMEIVRELFSDSAAVTSAVEEQFANLENALHVPLHLDAGYDQAVSLGEVLSSIIVSHFMSQSGIPVKWLDARTLVRTDETYREGKVNWEETEKCITGAITSTENQLYVIQGFIGGTTNGLTVTLGREGSDFTAAIVASSLGAGSVTIWKDVPGVMSADPKRFPDAVVFDELPFREAAEMTYYGASVIHPKTIKPLANKGIPLLVKNFDNPDLPGTRIHECTVSEMPPLIVFKENQCLISCKVTDYSFVNEQQLQLIFHTLTELDIRINVMQNSAISFSFCIDFRESRLTTLISRLQQHFEVYYNTGLTLITIKNYTPETFDYYRKWPGVILEQSSRSTLQVLVRNQETP